MKRKFLIICFLFFCSSVFADTPLVWQFATGGRLVTGVVFDVQGRIYALSEDRYLYCLESSGRLVWKTKLAYKPMPFLVLTEDNMILTADDSGTLYCTNLQRFLVWKKKFDSPVSSAPAIDSDGAIYAVTTDRRLHCLSYTGREDWTVELPYRCLRQPLIGDGGVVYAACENGLICAVLPWGEIWWQSPVGVNVRELMEGENGNIIYYSADGKAGVLDREGEKGWLVEDSLTFYSAVVDGKGALWILASEGVLVKIGPAGQIEWKKKIERKTGNQILLCREGALLYESGEGLIIVRSDGSGGSFFEYTEKISQPRIGNGLLVFASDDWNLHAFSITNDRQALWPQQGGTNGSRGRSPSSSSVWGIEDFFKKDPGYGYYQALAYGTSREEKQMFLDEASALLADSQTSRLERMYLLYLLEFLVTEKHFAPVTINGIQQNNFVDIRLSALALSGKQPNISLVRSFITLLKYEDDPTVVRNLILTLGQMKTDPDRMLFTYLLAAVKRPWGEPSGSEIAYAAANAAYNTVNWNGVADVQSLYQLVAYLSSGPWPDKVRSLAKDIIKLIK